MTSSALKVSIQLLQEELPDLRGIYCFGSFGTEYETQESDLDLAILPASPMNSLDRWQLQEKLAFQLKRDVDLVDLIKASTVFQWENLHSGQRLFTADKDSCDFFENFVDSAYLRLQESRQGILEDSRQIYRGKK